MYICVTIVRHITKECDSFNYMNYTLINHICMYVHTYYNYSFARKLTWVYVTTYVVA